MKTTAVTAITPRAWTKRAIEQENLTALYAADPEKKAEYAANAERMRNERAAWDAESASLRAAGWRESEFTVGQWFRVDPKTGKAARENGRVRTVTRAEALASLP